MEDLKITRQAKHVADYDIIVAGGGVAGVAAAVAAARQGKRVLLIEKSIGLGGLATAGLIDLFVPMCNGRGAQICRGMAQEMLELAVKYGYDTLPEAWRERKPEAGERTRYQTRFSAAIFTLVLTEFVRKAGVDILFDSMITEPVMEGKVCKGLVVENETGCGFYEAGYVIDATGSGDVLYRAGVPMIEGENYHTYMTFGTDTELHRPGTWRCCMGIGMAAARRISMGGGSRRESGSGEAPQQRRLRNMWWKTIWNAWRRSKEMTVLGVRSWRSRPCPSCGKSGISMAITR